MVTLVGLAGPAGKSWSGVAGARGSVSLRVRGPDGTEQANHRPVTTKRPRSETYSSVSSLLLAPGAWAWGLGGAELQGAPEDSLKPGDGWAQTQGRRPHFTLWMGGSSSSFWLALR